MTEEQIKEESRKYAEAVYPDDSRDSQRTKEWLAAKRQLIMVGFEVGFKLALKLGDPQFKDVPTNDLKLATGDYCLSGPAMLTQPLTREDILGL